MSISVGDQLPAPLMARLSIAHAVERADLAIVICTVDEDGWPYPAMLSSLEVIAVDARHIRLTIHAGSRTARNLHADGKLTLIVADEGGVFYIKGDVALISAAMLARPTQAMFNMRVASVREDNPAAYEHARVTTGIRVERTGIDMAAARAVLRELSTTNC